MLKYRRQGRHRSQVAASGTHDLAQSVSVSGNPNETSREITLIRAKQCDKRAIFWRLVSLLSVSFTEH